MPRNNTQEQVRIKTENEEEELPRKIQRRSSENSSSSSSSTSGELQISDLTTRIWELEQRTKGLEEIKSKQQEEIKSLTDGRHDLTIKCQGLEKSLQTQQEENKKLKEQLELGIKSTGNTVNTVSHNLRKSLEDQASTLTAAFNQQYASLQQKNTEFQNSLTNTEQRHNQALLTQYATLNNRVCGVEATVSRIEATQSTQQNTITKQQGEIGYIGNRLNSHSHDVHVPSGTTHQPKW